MENNEAGVVTPQVDSQPTEPQASDNSNNQNSPGPVPYERLKEVVQQKNEALAKAEEAHKKYTELESQFSELKQSLATTFGGKQTDEFAEIPETVRGQFKELYPHIEKYIFSKASQIQSQYEQEQARKEAEQAEQQQQESAETQRILEDFNKEFPEGSAEREEFIKFAEVQVEIYPEAGLDSIVRAYKKAHPDTEKQSNISNSSNARPEVKPEAPRKGESMLSAAMRAATEFGIK